MPMVDELIGKFLPRCAHYPSRSALHDPLYAVIRRRRWRRRRAGEFTWRDLKQDIGKARYRGTKGWLTSPVILIRRSQWLSERPVVCIPTYPDLSKSRLCDRREPVEWFDSEIIIIVHLSSHVIDILMKKYYFEILIQLKLCHKFLKYG